MNKSSLIIAFFTTMVRYYDYALFGLAAGALSENFIPGSSHNDKLFNFFFVFSISVIARPIGSIIFGNISDKYGRAISVKISASFAAISSCLITILPSYNQIGDFALIGLIICRMIFMISLAGDADAIRIYVAERVKNNKNFANGIVSCSGQIGALMAAFFYYLFYQNNFDQLWRVCFFIGGASGIIIIFLRKYFKETLEFELARKAIKHVNQNTLKEFQIIILNNKFSFILAILINGSIGGIYHFIIIFLSGFLNNPTTNLLQAEANMLNIKLIFLYGLMSLLSGFIADKYIKKYQILIALSASLIISLIGVFYYFSINLIMVLAMLMPFYVIPLQIQIQYMFNIEERMRLYSLSHSLGGIFLSSTAPLISMTLFNIFKEINIIFLYLVLLLIILLLSIITARKKNLIKYYNLLAK